MVDGGRGGRSEWYDGASLCGVNGVYIGSCPVAVKSQLTMSLSHGHIISGRGDSIYVLPTERWESCCPNLVIDQVSVN